MRTWWRQPGKRLREPFLATVRRSGKSYWEETVYLRFQSTPAYAELLEKEKREAEQEERE